MGKDVKVQVERRWVTENDRYKRQININKTSGTDTIRINGRNQWDSNGRHQWDSFRPNGS